jgi:ABC-2 type transport system permease protein
MRLPFDLKRVASMARKELRHILRDHFVLALGLGLPMVMVAFFGYVIELDVRDIHISMVDRDRSRASRQLAETFRSSGYFRVSQAVPGADFVRLLDSERARAIVVVEPGFGRDAAAGRTARAQVLLDGTDNSTAGVIAGYLFGVQAAATARITGTPPAVPLRMETRFLFNPELNSRWFIVPGLLAVVMAIMSIMLTALSVAREWETGSMELLLSTPVRPAEIILGKLGPYLGLAFVTVGFVYLLARVGLGVPFQGSHLIFIAGCLLFLIPCLAQGLLISVLARSQALAVQVSLVAGLLPPMLLSGFIFPIENMPAFFRYLTVLIPARWFITVSRGEFLKNAGLAELALPFAMLVALAALFVVASIKRFKSDLEP